MKRPQSRCLVVLLGMLAILAWHPTALVGQALTKYWVHFVDKDSANYRPEGYLSADALSNRLSQGLPALQYDDAPLKQGYVQAVAGLSSGMGHRSRWFNAVSVYLTASQKASVAALPFVARVSPITGYFYAAQGARVSPDTGLEMPSSFGPALSQIGAEAAINMGLDGKKVKIGLIDAGFKDADQSPKLQEFFEKKQLMGYRDFVHTDHSKEFFKPREDGSVDSHGTTVWGFVGGYDGATQYGLARGARYWLARTDNAKKEFRMEEDYWLAALEMMDSAGVRLINTSLGYSNGFDNKAEDHKTSEIDGKTSKVVQAVTLATVKKGIFVVVSAGNEGDDESWRIISTPADCQTALTVGATFEKKRLPAKRASYSSYGPSSLPYVKPDISCYSPNGTSFSAPIMTGMVACILQKYPKLTNGQLLQIIQLSGSLAGSPNNYLGYGIPDVSKALSLAAIVASGGSITAPKATAIKAINETVFLSPSADSKPCELLTVFEKEGDGRTVVKDEIRTAEYLDGKIIVQRQSSAQFSTVQLCDGSLYEIEWPQMK